MSPIAPVSDAPVAGLPLTGAPVLAVRFLGRFDVTIDGTPVPFGGSRRTRSLLAYLLDQGRRAVPRDRLMELFWPASTPEAARNSLHVAMWGVRKAIAAVWPGEVIARRGDTYRVVEGIDVHSDVGEVERSADLGDHALRHGHDVEAIAHYEAVLAAHTNEFLADEPYVGWALERRDQVRHRVLACADHLTELYLAAGDARRALAVAERVLRDEPCHEQVARRMMIAYARLGQSHMALRRYERLVAALQRELGVVPAPETVALANDISSRSPV